MSLTPLASQTLVAWLGAPPMTPPSVTTLADGGYVVVFDNADAVASGAELFAQRYDAGGGKVGGLFQVNTTTVLDETGGHVAALADGGFVVTFSSALDAEFTDIASTYRAQRYDASGQAVGGEVLIATNDLARAGGPPVAALPGGGYVTAYDDFDGSRANLLVQRFGPDGAPTGPPVAAGVAAGVGDIAVLSDGSYVTLVAGNTGGDLFVQAFDAGGVKAGMAVQANSSNLAGANRDGDIAALTTGGFVVTWAASTPNLVGSFPRILAQVFDATGAKVGAEFQVNTTLSTTGFSPRVTGLADGSFVVAWTGEDGNGAGILVRQFSATGAPLSGEVVVNGEVAGNQGAPTLTALSGGRVMVAWQDAEDGAIQQRIFQADAVAHNLPPPVQQTLSTGADAVAPLAADQLVRTSTATLAANDRLAGGAGTDTLRLTTMGTLDLTGPATLSGFERLEGSVGADTFLASQARLADVRTVDGGAGFDVLRLKSAGTLDVSGLTLHSVEVVAGSSGNDVLLGNAADNVLSGGAGADTMDGRGGTDTVSYFDAAGGVTVSLAITKAQNTGGGGRDTLKSVENLTGSSSSDTLTGSVGANVLTGAAGGDRLTGGGGPDTFAYGAAADSPSFARDLITDFSRTQGDRIDLSAIDPRAGGPDDAFVLVSAFTGAAGQLTVGVLGSGRFLVQADLDGDRTADLVIEVLSPTALTAADFLL